jgi:hypothetical protein
MFHTNMERKGRAISANSNLLIDFTHMPGKLLRIGRYVERYNCQKKLTDLLKLFFVLLAVELERVVHNIAVIEGGDGDRLLLFAGEHAF